MENLIVDLMCISLAFNIMWLMDYIFDKANKNLK